MPSEREVGRLAIVERSRWGRAQSHRLEGLYELDERNGQPYRLKVSIKLDDSYPEQSRLTASVWRDEPHLDWSVIARVVGTEPACLHPTLVDTDHEALTGNARILLTRAIWALGFEVPDEINP